MKHERNHQAWDAGEAAVWLVADEAMRDAVATHDDADRSADAETLAAAGDVRRVDAALRALARGESPDAVEMRRMRDAAIRTTRAHALEAMHRRTLAYSTDGRRLPRWPIAAAVAASVIVGFVVWVTNQAPTQVVATNSLLGDADQRAREEWRAEYNEYFPLVTAFNAVEPADSLVRESLEEIDSDVSALSMLSGTTDN